MVIDIGPYPFDDERIETVRKAEPEKRWFKFGRGQALFARPHDHEPEHDRRCVEDASTVDGSARAVDLVFSDS
jgi:hypothetical protein